MIWQFILDLLNIATEVWLGYWIFDVPSCRRFHSRQARILEYVMFLGLPGGFGLANRLTGIRFSGITGVILGTLFFIAAVIFTKYGLLRSLAWSFFYYETLSVLELPGLILDGWLRQIPYIESIFSDHIYSYIYFTVLTFLLIGLAVGFGHSIKTLQKYIFTGKINLLWIALALVEYCFNGYFLWLGLYKTGSEFFLFGILYALSIMLLIAMIFILQSYRLMEKRIYSDKLHDMEIDMAYERVKKEYERKSQALHDFKHQLAALAAYLKDGAYESAKTYLQAMTKELDMSPSTKTLRTGSPLADMILDSKLKTASAYGIQARTDIQSISSPLSERDMSILLGNLLDNAIEAAVLSPEGEKMIRIQIIGKGAIMIIHIENSIGQMPVEKNGQLVSSKADGSDHGWGMKSIRSIVEQNHGRMKYMYDDKTFSISIEFGITEKR